MVVLPRDDAELISGLITGAVLPRFTSLDLAESDISDLTPLAVMPDRRGLGLRGLATLTWLRHFGNGMFDVTPLADLEALVGPV